ncbi:response regulator [Candidatus Margulisiibacteriota bacterium]
MQCNCGQPIDILLVEDNPGDVLLTEEAFKEEKLCNNIHVAKDGEEAMKFLRKKGKYSNAPHPDLVLLDLKLPGKNGWEVLKEIKADPELKSIPVVVLTASEKDEDVIKSFDLHATSYLSKPVTLYSFVDVIRNIGGFRLTVVKGS